MTYKMFLGLKDFISNVITFFLFVITFYAFYNNKFQTTFIFLNRLVYNFISNIFFIIMPVLYSKTGIIIKNTNFIIAYFSLAI